MGVACFPNQGTTGGELLANADMAMYRAKELGRNNIQVFTEAMAARAMKSSSRKKSFARRLRGRSSCCISNRSEPPRPAGIFAAEGAVALAAPRCAASSRLRHSFRSPRKPV